MQLLQDPNQRSLHNLNNVRREASRRFGNKKRQYGKAKINVRALCFIILTCYYSGDQIKKNEMGRVCSTCGGQ